MWIKVELGNFSNWYEVRINGRLVTNARSRAEGIKIAEDLTKKRRTKYGKVGR